ncbi:hypothetical protein BKI49_10235 [Streptomyces sp. Tue6028]|uniref:hypothetical protein n=1 Tax=Streptomyces sp. Tue6028 TaxID=2036037 RepID=UPI000BB39624|nr:hypothetical protein [Streptomyces sp. Tue6028]PBC64070.1 hypothetical protein BKI49_10235 [Streptomyces sp. Tue6028]
MKTIDEQYDDGYHGALFTAEAAEQAWLMGGLDSFLAPAVRQRLTAYRDLRHSCDTAHQLADDAMALSRTAADYGALRRALFYDATQHGAEPPWRIVQRGSFAVRIRPRLHRCAEAALVLSQGGHEVPAWARAWTFTALSNPFNPKDPGTCFPVTLYRHFEHTEPAKDSYLIDAPPELEQHGEWYRQMFYGFLALGMKVSLGAVTHEDTKRRVVEGPDRDSSQESARQQRKAPEAAPRDADARRDCPGTGQKGEVIFQEPGDDWHVKCRVCGTRWAGGSDIVPSHNDRRSGFHHLQ